MDYYIADCVHDITKLEAAKMRQARRLLLVDKPDKKDLMTLLPEDFEKPDQGGSEEKTIIGFHI